MDLIFPKKRLADESRYKRPELSLLLPAPSKKDKKMTEKKIFKKNKNAIAFPRDYRVHPNAESEWWYTFAFLDNRYTFVSYFWRYRANRKGDDGLICIYALTEIDGMKRWKASLINKTILTMTRDMLGRINKKHKDIIAEAILEVTDDNTIFAPYRLVKEAHCASSENHPVDMRVGPCNFLHDAENQSLHLRIKELELQCDMKLNISADCLPMAENGSFKIGGRKIQGYSHPMVKVAGTITTGGHRRQFSGEAWCDHQWGEWLFNDFHHKYYHPMRNYFGVFVNGNKSIIICQDKKPNKEGFDKELIYGFLYDHNGSSKRFNRVNIKCKDYEESIRTNNLYEYGWVIDIPELNYSFDITPFHPDHEIYTFTRQRGVMELGCQVKGDLEGETCAGVAFAEIYGEVLDINDFFWGQKKTNLSRQLNKLFPRSYDPDWLKRICGMNRPLIADESAITHAIIDPIWSMMDRGGKGWRAAWLTTCCYALGFNKHEREIHNFLPLSELIHTGSLVIDDIQDMSEYRRGKPTLHRLIGTDLAINVGNLLYFLPYIIIKEASWLTDAQKLEIYNIITNAMRQGHIGQAMDLMSAKGRYDFEKKANMFDKAREELVEQYRLKTGCQLHAIAEMAGVITHSSKSLVEPLTAYSSAFGVVFQIVDDLIDIQEGKDRLGKEENEDIRNSKVNMVLLYALSEMSGPRRASFIELILNADQKKDYDRVSKIIHATEAIPRCITFAEEMIEDAWKEISNFPPTDAKVAMRVIPRWLINQRREKAVF
jgi:geranylgeranyl pyrophosphate synthase/predicted secreted hydrolase